MDLETQAPTRPVLLDMQTYDAPLLRKVTTGIRVRASLDSNDRTGRRGVDWVHGTEADEEALMRGYEGDRVNFEEIVTVVGFVEERFIHYLKRFLSGSYLGGNPRSLLYQELYKSTADGVELIADNINQGLKRHIVKVARMYIMIFLMYHDNKDHLFSKLNSAWYGEQYLLVCSTLLQSHPEVFTTHAVEYLDKVVVVKRDKILRMATVDYIVQTGHRHIQAVINRMGFVNFTIHGAVLCDCIHEYYQGSSVSRMWETFPRCTCCGDKVTMELMNAAKNDHYGNFLGLYTRVAIICYLSQVHGIPFVDLLPNRSNFMVARFAASWSDDVLQRLEDNCNDQIQMCCESYRSCPDHIGRFCTRLITQQRMISGFLSPPPHTCLFCVDELKCALCKV